MNLTAILCRANLAKTSAWARRMIEGQAVKVNGIVVNSDEDYPVGSRLHLAVGSKIIREVEFEVKAE